MPYNYQWVPESGATYKADSFETEYKGFKITKDGQYQIYRIKPPLGKTLHKALEGGFTRLALAEEHIDAFIKNYGTKEALEDNEAVSLEVGRPTNAEINARKNLELEQRLATLLEEYKR